ncbi:MAG TPA: MFS transporter [Candidatus Limnocylindrales bacterium]|nr:MFS transporter [Candidatus Limnocylindrales bacterium]
MTSGPSEGRRSRLGNLTPSGRPIVPIAWSLYDFANTIFSFAVVSGAIGLWLTEAAQFGERDGNVLLSVAVVVSVGINAIVSPILGALSDRTGRRLPFLLFFTLLCIVPTALIGFSPAALGLTLFVVANFAYQAALIYYDATLKVVSLPSTRGTLSGIGVAVGYMGTVFVGLLIFLAEIPVSDRFLLSAVLFGLFAVPIFAVVREPRLDDAQPITARIVLGSWSQLARTIEHARDVPGLLRFLVGRFFYSDAVNTIIVVMSIVAVRAVGLTDTEAILVLLALTVVAIGASFAWGTVVDRLGPKRTLLIILASWAVGLAVGGLSLGLDNPLKIVLFLFAGGILGSGLGGVQVADRVLMVRLSPPERLGEFFGLYGLVGKGSQVIGQLAYGAVIFLLFDSLGTGAYQVAVLSLLATMLIGAWLLLPVSDQWAGSGEIPHEHGQPPLPERLAPGSAPIEPRTGEP